MVSRLKRFLEHPLAAGLDIDSPELTERRRQIIQQKRFLQRIYISWYTRIARNIPQGNGPVLELGSGAGFCEDFVPSVIRSEVFHLADMDLTLSGTNLPFGDGSLDAIVMTNVFHHIPDVKAMLSEAARCVKPGGAVLMIEPWNTPFAALVYRYLHHEPFEPDAPNWDIGGRGPLSDANGALAWIVFERDCARFVAECPEWEITSVEPFMPLRYLVSGGISMRDLVPAWSYGAWVFLETLFKPTMGHVAMFAFIHLKRR